MKFTKASQIKIFYLNLVKVKWFLLKVKLVYNLREVKKYEF
jgi:hypothetical protein